MRINFTSKPIDEITEFFLTYKDNCSKYPEAVYNLLPECYGGSDIEDKIIEKYRFDDNEPTHFTLKFSKDQAEIIVTFEYCEGFGASHKKVIQDQTVTIRI